MLLIRDYMDQVAVSDSIDQRAKLPIALGLVGEIGSALASAKKYEREGSAYIEYVSDLEEEFGDILWYFNAISYRIGTNLEHIFHEIAVEDGNSCWHIGGYSSQQGQLAILSYELTYHEMNAALVKMSKLGATTLEKVYSDQLNSSDLVEFGRAYLETLNACDMGLEDVANNNVRKVNDRFIRYPFHELPQFDTGFPEDEQIPEHFEIQIVQASNNRAYLRWNGVIIGDALSDNIADKDGYRFHDVFHMAYAAILHWSPTFRAVTRRKRKSSPNVEEAEDSGRPIVVEEGLSAWLFARSKGLNFFEGLDKLPFTLLKTVREFTKGYEVEQCKCEIVDLGW